jgi:hypothetical protein
MTRQRIPMIVAAVSGEKLFETVLDLLEPLGPIVDVILETSHQCPEGDHQDLTREGIDLPVLMSHFCDHEDLLLNDGCTGVAVMDERGTMEVQFDEHKLLVVYARDLEPFMEILESHGICRNDGIKFVTEAEHLHSTHPHYFEEFEQFCCVLGAEEPVEQEMSW